MRVFVAGGTGLVGTALVRRLLERNDHVALLTRRPEHARQTWAERCEVVAGDPTQPGPWQDALARCDALVNLTGEGVFNRRWNAAFKETLRASRVQSTSNIVEALAKNPRRADGAPKTLVNASAIGYYGPHGDEELDETAPPGDDFLAQLCVAWEQAARAAEASGIRLVIVRIGVVLDRSGGALPQMLTPFKMFVGGPVGSGRQIMSWIHLDDLVGLILFALDRPQVHGVLNATAPHPVTNKEFSQALGAALGRPSLLRTPGFALRVMLGEVANVVTRGQRVLPKAALQAGFQFRHENVEDALRSILNEPVK